MTYGEFEYGVAKRKLTTLADNLEFRRIKGYKQMGVLMAMLDEQAAVSARVLIA